MPKKKNNDTDFSCFLNRLLYFKPPNIEKRKWLKELKIKKQEKYNWGKNKRADIETMWYFTKLLKLNMEEGEWLQVGEGPPPARIKKIKKKKTKIRPLNRGGEEKTGKVRTLETSVSFLSE